MQIFKANDLSEEASQLVVLVLKLVGWFGNGHLACFIFLFGYFYSASSSSPLGLLLRGAPDTARILFRSFSSKRHRTCPRSLEIRTHDLSDERGRIYQ